MKKTIKLAVVFAIAALMCMLLAVFASAETYNVKYADIGSGVKNTVKTDEDGKIVLRDTAVTSKEGKVFYGWFDENGTFYKPGTELTLTADTLFREAYAFPVTDLAGLKTYLSSSNGWGLVRLDADLDLSEATGAPGWQGGGGIRVFLDLNGHTINYTGTDNLFSSTRIGLDLLNSSEKEAKITANNLGSDKAIIAISKHGWGDGKQLGLSVGKNVRLETNGSLFRVGNFFNDGTGGEADECPYIRIWGTVVARTLVDAKTNLTHMADIEIHDVANVTLTGTTWWENPSTKAFNPFASVVIDDGAKITMTNPDFKWFPSVDYVIKVEYNVTGGTFNVKIPDGILKYGYDDVYDASTGLYNVKYIACDLEGSNGEHTFKIQEPFNDMAATCDLSGLHYYRCMCGSAYIDDVAPLGHSYTAVTIEKIATATENGIKRVTCENCDDSYTYEYSFDPGDQTITIVVKTDGGNKEITALVKDFYNYTVSEDLSGFVASFDSVKTFADPDNAETTYTIANIVKLVVPAGFTSIKTGAIKNATALEEIVLLDGANLTFASKSIDNCTALESIVLGDCTVTFSGNTINGNTADLTIDASKANVTTLTSAFEGKSTLKHFVMGTGKSYDFAASTFKTAGIEEFVVPDYATLKAAYATCYQANNLKYVYIGRGITSIDNIFDQCYYMQTIVLMDVTNITGQYFACLANKGEDVLRIYHHGTSLSTGNNFLYQSHGVILYTNATGWKGSMSSCSAITKTVGGVDVEYPAYTIVKGIPHQYIEGGVDATCTAMGSTGYTTDCPCGVVADATYTTYKGVNAGTAVNGTTVTEGSITVGTTTPALGHEFYENDAEKQIIVSTTPATCIKDATITYKCARCDETKTVVQEDTATGHTPEAEWTVTLEPTCAADGFKQKICTVCNTLAEGEVIPAIGHQASGEWVTIQEATCSVGATRVQYCKNEGCGFVALSETTEPNGHTPSTEWTVTVPATCEKAGEKENRCTVCRAIIEVVVIDALGHEFDIADGAVVNAITYSNGFDKNGMVFTKCARCDATNEGECEPIFTAKGYSLSADRTGLNGGFSINVDMLTAYESLNPALDFGIVIANANSFAGASFFNAENKVNSEKSVVAEAKERGFSSFDCSINGFGANSGTLELVITMYVIDAEGNVTYVQAQNDYANAVGEEKIADGIFTSVTLDLVKANIPEPASNDALLPSNDEE